MTITEAAAALRLALRDLRDAALDHAFDPYSIPKLRALGKAGQALLIAEHAMSDAEVEYLTSRARG